MIFNVLLLASALNAQIQVQPIPSQSQQSPSNPTSINNNIPGTSYINAIKLNALESQIRQIQNGKPTITAIPTFKNGICFGDGTCQAVATVTNNQLCTTCTVNANQIVAGTFRTSSYTFPSPLNLQGNPNALGNLIVSTGLNSIAIGYLAVEPSAGSVVVGSKQGDTDLYTSGYNLNFAANGGVRIPMQLKPSDELFLNGLIVTNHPWIDVANYSTLAGAVSGIGGSTITLVIQKSVSTTAPLTIPSNLSVAIIPGGSINNNGNLLEIDGSFSAGRYQIFSGTGTVIFSSGSIDHYYPEWRGVLPGISTSATVDTAINLVSSDTILSGLPLLWGQGTYNLGNINIVGPSGNSEYGIIWKGVGSAQLEHGQGSGTETPPMTKLKFYKTDGSRFINFQPNDGTPLFRFKDLTIEGSHGYGDGIYISTGVGFTSAIKMNFEDVTVLNFGGNGIYCYYCQNGTMWNVTTSSDGTGIYWDNNSNSNSFYNFVGEYNTNYAVKVASDDTIGFFGGLIQNNYGTGMYLTGDKAISVQNVHFENNNYNSLSSATYHSVLIEGVPPNGGGNIYFRSNKFAEQKNANFRITAVAGYSPYVLLDGNVFGGTASPCFVSLNDYSSDFVEERGDNNDVGVCDDNLVTVHTQSWPYGGTTPMSVAAANITPRNSIPAVVEYSTLNVNSHIQPATNGVQEGQFLTFIVYQGTSTGGPYTLSWDTSYNQSWQDAKSTGTVSTISFVGNQKKWQQVGPQSPWISTTGPSEQFAYVPYNGSIHNLNLGTNNLNANKVTATLSGDGSGVTSLTSTQLLGIVPSAVLPSTVMYTSIGNILTGSISGAAGLVGAGVLPSTTVFTTSTQTFTAQQLFTAPAVFSSSVSITGVSDNSDAQTGLVGEFLSNCSASNPAPTTSGNYLTVATVTLSAGDWDVSATMAFNEGNGTTTLINGCISKSTGACDLTNKNNIAYINATTSFPAGSDNIYALGPRRFTSSATQSAYLSVSATYSVLSNSNWETLNCIQARRVR